MAGLLLIMIFGVLAVAVVLIVVFQKRRRPAPQEPSCGKCGYVVTGLPSFTCPECGSDLREVGILTADTRRPLSPLVKGLIWTIAFPPLALLLSAIITGLGLNEYLESRNYVAAPISGAYTRIKMVGTAKGSSSSRLQTETLVLELTTNPTPSSKSKTSELTVKPAHLGYQYAGKDGKPVSASDGFDAHVILDWLEANGVDGGNAAVQKEAGELLAQAQAMNMATGASAPMPSFNNLSSWTQGTYGPPRWWTITQLILWPLLWLLGLWRFTRRRTRTSPAPNR